jgi:phenylacetate-coenzyme A ligase PaaK-like adenylate-forming protein
MHVTEAINTLVRSYNNPYSDFYRRLYTDNKAVADLLADQSTTENWSAVPFLTRAAIQATPLAERLFIPWAEVEALRLTSGTSGKGALCMPRLSRDHDTTTLVSELFQTNHFKRMATFSGAQFLYADSFRTVRNHDSMQLDVQDMSMAVKQVRAFRPDALAGFAYALEALAYELRNDSLRQEIKGLHLYGEKCSPLLWQDLQQKFPNAIIFAEYSSVDAQTIVGFPCQEIVAAREPLVHGVPEYAYCEIINPDTGAVVTEVDTVGELVLTVLREVAFPLVRYRTGDMARIVRHDCGCGTRTPVLSIEGRLASDRIRFSGGELVVGEVDRVFASLQLYGVKDNYLLHYTEVAQNGVILPQVSVTVEWDQTRIDKTKLAAQIAKELRVGPGRTYAAAVADGKCLPLSVTFTAREQNRGKRVRIIRT